MSWSSWLKYCMDLYYKQNRTKPPEPDPEPVIIEPPAPVVDPLMPSGDPWWPNVEGTWIKYRRFIITGILVKNTLQISVTSRKFLDEAKLNSVHTKRDGETLFGINHPGGGVIFDGWSTINGKKYIGERINQDNATYNPCLPKLASIKEKAGIVKGSSLTYDHTGKFIVDNPWQFNMINKLDWGTYGECWWTGLWETNYSCYNYIFKENVGCVDFWFIDPATGKGYQYHAVEY